MAFVDDVAAVLAETSQLRTALKGLITTMTAGATNVTLRSIQKQRFGTDNNRVRVSVVIEADSLSDAVVAQLDEIGKALRIGDAAI